MNKQDIGQQNRQFTKTGGVSKNNRRLKFIPAFMDSDTGEVSPSLFENGAASPIHLLEGLPAHWAVAWDSKGRISRVKESVVAGFLRDNQFYTRQETADLVAAQQVAA